jgi:hypothetical protein
MAVYWSKRWERRAALLQPLLAGGMALGLVLVVFLHDSNLVNKIIHRKLPPKFDLSHRAHGWKEMARMVGQARVELAAEGPPAFIIAEHYGFAAQLSFYLPEAKRQVNAEPLVYFMATSHPRNQFYYWPNYLPRAGQNALFVREIDRPALRPDWFARWRAEDPDIFLPGQPQGGPAPPEILRQFEACTNLGVRDVVFGGSIVRRVQLIQCLRLH